MAGKLEQILRIIRSVRAEHGTKVIFVLISRPLEYLYYQIFKNRCFQFDGKTYRYFYHLYNTTFRKERSVEIPIIMGYVEGEKGKAILEVGNVLSNYFSFEHDVVDKYEMAEGVVNQDIVGFAPGKKYDLIVSISTLEHVGWDETPREKDKILKALENMRGLLNNGGRIVITMPLGYNGDLNSLLRENSLPFTSIRFLKRISADNQWREVDFEEVKDARYGYLHQNANAIVIGIVQK